MSSTTLFVSKLSEGVALILFEIFSKKNFGEVLARVYIIGWL